MTLLLMGVGYLVIWVVTSRILDKYVLDKVYDAYEIEENTAPPGSMKPTSWSIWMGAIWPLTLATALLVWLLTRNVFKTIRKALLRIVLGRTS